MSSSEHLINESIQMLGKGENLWSEAYISQNKKRFIRDLDQIRKMLSKPGMHVADLGAAPFVTSLAIQNLGHKVDCFDIAPERFSDIKNFGLSLKKMDLDNWHEPEENAYDVIILTEVFEHLRGNLIETTVNVFNSLKPGGILYLTTPNFRSVTGIYKFLFKKVSYACSKDLYHEWNKLREVGHMGHVREYTYHELIYFFEKNGFDVKETFTRPALLGPGLKNNILYGLERFFNPLSLGSTSTFIFSKSNK